MKPTKFVNLHSHTSFSINDGMDYPQEHIDFIIENGGTAWAMTDHGNLDGFAHAWLHVQKLRKQGIDFKFIPGCEMYIHPDLTLWQVQYDLKKATKDANSAEMVRLQSLLDTMKTPKSAFLDINNENIEIDDNEVELDFEDENATKSSKFYDPLKRRHHMVVLPRNSKGLESLFSLISKGYDTGFYRFPRVDFKQIKEVNKDHCLIALSACIGGLLSYQIFQHFQTLEFDDLKPSLLDDPKTMEKIINSVRDGYHDMIDAFGEEYTFLELQFNKLNAQHLANRALIEFARREGLTDKLVVTCDSHYSRPEKWLAREMYKALGWYDKAGFTADSLPKTKDDLKCELYPKNQTQVWDSYIQYTEDYDFYNDTEIVNAIENTHHIAYDLIGDIEIDTSMKLPSYTIPDGKTANQALIDMVKEGLINKGLDQKPEYIEAAKYELKVIIQKNFAEYFLTTKAIMDLAYDNMPTGAGRGSGAGSLVNYVLNITKLDPLKYGLYFSRFMDPTRSDYPDIDNDVADRDGLIKLMKKKWGDNNILPISNFNRFQLKSLVKDIWKFYGLDFKVINNALVKLDAEVLQGLRNDGKEPNGPLQLNFQDAMEYSANFRKLMEENPEVAEHIDNLFKQNKTIGKHAGGVIVSENILDRMPVRKVRGDLQTPWVEGASYKHLEDFGWIKFDILGVAALDNIKRAIGLVLQKQGVKNPTWLQIRAWWEKHLDPDVIDFEDSNVFDVYKYSKWGGIFQATNAGAQNLFRLVQPNSIEEISAITAIYRPGPLSMGVDKAYVKTKRNPNYISYDHPSLEPILKDTFGHIIYQEQVMAIVNQIAGIPMEECNSIRKMMKPQQSSTEAVKKAKALEDRIVTGFRNHGLSQAQSNTLYSKIMKFTAYSFNKSHSLSYAILSYQCAYMMAYHEGQWLAAYLENMSDKPEDKNKALAEVKSLGYKIVPLDINHAQREWTILSGKRFMPSFGSIKGVGDTAIDEIIRNRPYTNLDSIMYNDNKVWKLSKFNKRSFEALVKVKAFESLDIVGPGKLFDNYNHMVSITSEWSKFKKRLKKDALAGYNLLYETIETNRGIQDFTRRELVMNEKSHLGSVNIETLIPARYYNRFEDEGWMAIDDWESDKKPCWFIVEQILKKKTKTGKHYLRLKTSGSTGKQYWMNCWNWNGVEVLEPYTVCVGFISKSDYGMSCRWNKMEIFVE